MLIMLLLLGADADNMCCYWAQMLIILGADADSSAVQMLIIVLCAV